MKCKNTILENTFTINCKGKLLNFVQPIVMGILNVTDDSFYDGGNYKNDTIILKQVRKMLNEGADIIDIGAFSSRPGAKIISFENEETKLRKILKLVRGEFPEITISVDTYRSDIAKIVIEEFGVDIINDISAGSFDTKMFKTIAKLNVPYIIMHMQGNPENMQDDPKYDNVVQDLIKYFAVKVHELRNLGVIDIIIDPGFGFGKNIEHNYQIIKYLNNFKVLNLPLLIGVSRKSFIYKLLEIDPDNALNGTTALHALALYKGVNVLRVHDVKEAKEAIKIVEMIKSVQ